MFTVIFFMFCCTEAIQHIEPIFSLIVEGCCEEELIFFFHKMILEPIGITLIIATIPVLKKEKLYQIAPVGFLSY